MFWSGHLQPRQEWGSGSKAPQSGRQGRWQSVRPSGKLCLGEGVAGNPPRITVNLFLVAGPVMSAFARYAHPAPPEAHALILGVLPRLAEVRTTPAFDAPKQAQ